MDGEAQDVGSQEGLKNEASSEWREHWSRSLEESFKRPVLKALVLSFLGLWPRGSRYEVVAFLTPAHEAEQEWEDEQWEGGV